MARFSVGGNGDGNRRSPRSCSGSPSSKKFRFSDAVGSASSSDTSSRSETNDLMRPVQIQERTANDQELGRECEHESNSSFPASPDEESVQKEQLGAEVLTAEPQQISTSNIAGDGVSKLSEPRGSSQAARIVVTLEQHTLDCPICIEPLKLPVYQCDNGHIACESCCTKMRNKCGSCCFPIGYNRCRALEKVIDSVIVQCPNMVHGCVETFKYDKKSNHEKTCKHAPCSCPFARCFHSGFYMDLYSHLQVAHPSSFTKIHFGDTFEFSLSFRKNHVVLVDEDEGIVFILNRHDERHGMYAYVACIAPTSSERQFKYELAARDKEDTFSLKLCSVTENTPEWTERHRPRRCLFVPDICINEEPIWELTIWM